MLLLNDKCPMYQELNTDLLDLNTIWTNKRKDTTENEHCTTYPVTRTTVYARMYRHELTTSYILGPAVHSLAVSA